MAFLCSQVNRCDIIVHLRIGAVKQKGGRGKDKHEIKLIAKRKCTHTHTMWQQLTDTLREMIYKKKKEITKISFKKQEHCPHSRQSKTLYTLNFYFRHVFHGVLALSVHIVE